MLLLDHSGDTHPGKVRKNNEDSLLVGGDRDETLFVVADGIGGFEAGEVASRIAIEVLQDVAPTASLKEAIREANRRILAAAREDERLRGMGTTVVAMRFNGTQEEPLAEISHVGDSRAYLLRGGELKPVTEDHSLVAELVRSGDLTRAQASEHPQKNLITRALGAEEEVEVDTIRLPVEPEDRLILCSDGLSDMVPEPKILDILTTSSSRAPEGATRGLVAAALDAGGADNVTVVVVDVREEESTSAGQDRSDTEEMRSVTPEEANLETRPPRGSPRRRSQSRGTRGERAKGGGLPRALGTLVRALAVVLVLMAAATPVYLWASSRHFLGFEEDEVVIYRGLPYALVDYELNERVDGTGLMRNEIDERYRGPVENNRLYSSEEEAREVVRGLEAEASPRNEDPAPSEEPARNEDLARPADSARNVDSAPSENLAPSEDLAQPEDLARPENETQDAGVAATGR